MAVTDRLIGRYYLFRITNSAGLYLPVAILYLQDQGFSLGFIGLVYAVFGFATLIAEIPTGYLGDWLGQRESLAVGVCLRAAVLGAYPFVGTEPAYLALHVIWGVGWAFRSGTQDAWLYDLLLTHFDEAEYARVHGRGSTLLLAASAVGALIGSTLYPVFPTAPFVSNALLAIAGLPLLLTFPAVGATADAGFSIRVADAIRTLRLQLGRPDVRWLVLYAALFYGLFVATRIFEQPALDSIGVPVAGIGVIYAAFKLVSAAAAWTVGWVNETLGIRGAFALLIPLYGLGYASLWLTPMLLVPVLFMNRGLRTIVRPIRNQYLNDRIPGVGRATVLSGVSMVLGLVGGFARLGAGQVAEAFGPVGFLPILGVLGAVAGGLLWFGASPIRSPAESTLEPPSSGEQHV